MKDINCILYAFDFLHTGKYDIWGRMTPDIIVYCFPLEQHPREGEIGVVILMYPLPTREGGSLPNLNIWWSAGFASSQLSFSFWLLSMWWCGLVRLEKSERFFFSLFVTLHFPALFVFFLLPLWFYFNWFYHVSFNVHADQPCLLYCQI